MTSINATISENLKKLRRDRKLSLQDLSDLCGVSKSMLGEIERGTSNPTITVIWKIAEGLKVPFTALTTSARPTVQLVKSTEHQGFLNGEGVSCATVFNYNPITRTEIYLESFEPGSCYESEGHHGVHETLIVIAGTLTLSAAGSTYEICAGDSILFKATTPHKYCNRHHEACQVYMILHYDV